MPVVAAASFTASGAICADIDGALVHVPDDPANADRHLIAASGIVIAPCAPVAPALADYVATITAHLDTAARGRQYDGALSIASYLGSAVPAWAAEAAAFVAWRDAVWTYALAELARVEAAEREAPTIAELIAELPVLAWPA